MEALLYGCMTWAARRDHYRLLRRTHHRLLLRVIGYRDKFNDLGGRGCNVFVPILRGNGTKIAPTGERFDQPPGQMRWIWGKLADHVGNLVVSSP